MIWVQTVCKGYQQTTKFSTSKERVNRGHICQNKIVVISYKKTAMKYVTCVDPEGPDPLENHKNIGFYSNNIGADPL